MNLLVLYVVCLRAISHVKHIENTVFLIFALFIS